MGRAHEPHRIDAPTLHKLGGLFVGVFVAILYVMYVLWQHVHSRTLNLPPPVLPPQPRLQVEPPADRTTQYRAQMQQLTTYGWNDGSHRTAHIPIERAMTLLVQQQAASKPASGPASGSSSP
jgi:hypothetical protein